MYNCSSRPETPTSAKKPLWFLQAIRRYGPSKLGKSDVIKNQSSSTRRADRNGTCGAPRLAPGATLWPRPFSLHTTYWFPRTFKIQDSEASCSASSTTCLASSTNQLRVLSKSGKWQVPSMKCATPQSRGLSLDPTSSKFTWQCWHKLLRVWTYFWSIYVVSYN